MEGGEEEVDNFTIIRSEIAYIFILLELLCHTAPLLRSSLTVLELPPNDAAWSALPKAPP
jgi:hypothetical protein